MAIQIRTTNHHVLRHDNPLLYAFSKKVSDDQINKHVKIFGGTAKELKASLRMRGYSVKPEPKTPSAKKVKSVENMNKVRAMMGLPLL